LHRAWKMWNDQEKFDAETHVAETPTSAEDAGPTRDHR